MNYDCDHDHHGGNRGGWICVEELDILPLSLVLVELYVFLLYIEVYTDDTMDTIPVPSAIGASRHLSRHLSRHSTVCMAVVQAARC